MSYTTGFKLQVIETVETSGNRSAEMKIHSLNAITATYTQVNMVHTCSCKI